MGLDGVELVMAWEEAFGIDIPDVEAAKLRTARDAMDFIYSRLPHGTQSGCLSQASFHRIRRSLVEAVGVSRAAVTPEARLEELVPRVARRERWQQLEKTAALSGWPALSRPNSVTQGILLGSVAASLAAFLISPVYRVWAAVLAFAAMGMTTYRLTTPWAQEVPEAVPTVGALAQALGPVNASRLVRQEGWTREQVREVVRTITIQELGVPPDFSDDAEFVRDLGVG